MSMVLFGFETAKPDLLGAGGQYHPAFRILCYQTVSLVLEAVTAPNHKEAEEEYKREREQAIGP